MTTGNWRKLAIGRIFEEPAHKARLVQLLEKNRKVCDDTGCIEWTGTLTPVGYGQTRLHLSKKQGHAGKPVTITVHRLSYALAHDRDPGEMHVLHKCDNRACFNPDHLFLGTHQDNMRDMVQKGRHAAGNSIVGEKQNGAKHTNEQAATVANLFRSGLSNRQIVETTGLGIIFISNVTSGRAWTPITGLPRRIKVKRSRTPKPRAEPNRKRRWLIVGMLREKGPRDTSAIAAAIGESLQLALTTCLALERDRLLVRDARLGPGLPLIWSLASEESQPTTRAVTHLNNAGPEN